MLDSIYHMTLKLLINCIFGVKMTRFCHLLRNIITDIITLINRKSLVVYPFHCMGLYRSQMQCHAINWFK